MKTKPSENPSRRESATFTTQRIYDYWPATGRTAVFVDRLYPRGVTEEKFTAAEWLENIVPSTELCRQYHEDPARHFAASATRYHEGSQGETQQKAVARLSELEKRHSAVLISIVVKDPQQPHVSVLAQYLDIPFVCRQAV